MRAHRVKLLPLEEPTTGGGLLEPRDFGNMGDHSESFPDLERAVLDGVCEIEVGDEREVSCQWSDWLVGKAPDNAADHFKRVSPAQCWVTP